MSGGTPSTSPPAMSVAQLYRYPVKSMLGEPVDHAYIAFGGIETDRRLALVDAETGHIASAKQPRKWAGLLQLRARAASDGVVIRTPDGDEVAADSPGVHDVMSGLVGRQVKLCDHREHGATLERPDPEKLLRLGLDVDVPTPIIEIGRATPGDTFHDVAPLHAMTTATLARIGAEEVRYRPNLVLATPPDYPPYAENDWTGRELAIGEVRLRVIAPTHRCVVPTLEHGGLPPAPDALRIVAAQNRIPGPDAKMLACAGVYLQVLRPGAVAVGDVAELAAAPGTPGAMG